MKEKQYIAIDLKSFYASVECKERGLNPLDTHLVVADESRTDKTVCLAVTPSLKEYGISGRARLYEVKQKVKYINMLRRGNIRGREFCGSSYKKSELHEHTDYSLDFIVAPPRMALYMKYSTQIYDIYLKYIAPEDIVIYSIDEVFIDVTNYLDLYGKSARALAMTIILDVLNTTGITATAGIGPNLFLCKVALDVGAKHILPDENGVRIAELTERSYRETLWDHKPITDIWRVGHGTAARLSKYGIETMGDIARTSIENEDRLYKLFGKNAELLIDHAWGYEPCTIKDIKGYKPQSNSRGSGQVLHTPYTYEKARVVMSEMADALSLDLVERRIVTRQIVITVGYDIENIKDEGRKQKYQGEIVLDRYGREIPKHSHGTENLEEYTSSSRLITDAALRLFDRITDKTLLIRRLNISALVITESEAQKVQCEQLDLFTDYEKKEREKQKLSREKNMQEAVIKIKKKYGKNAILKGVSFTEGATAKDRNSQIGGHKK